MQAQTKRMKVDQQDRFSLRSHDR